MNVILLIRNWFCPYYRDLEPQVQRRTNTALFFLMLSLAAGAYSFCKWQAAGHIYLIESSMFLMVMELTGALVLKFTRSIRWALNFGFVGMMVNCFNLIYQTGGFVVSSQTLWIAVLFISFYLTATLLSAFIWSGFTLALTILMAYGHTTGYPYPNLPDVGNQVVVEAYTGAIVPSLIICAGLWFLINMRDDALSNASRMQHDAELHAQSAEQGAKTLSGVLTQVEHGASELSDVSNILSAQSTQLGSNVNLLNQSCEGQSSASEQITQQLHQFTMEMDTVAQALNQLADDSTVIDNKAQSSSVSLSATHEAITKIAETNKQITTVAAMITSVAEQTNLLALNAAIEAARAGEQGRGFAVVAEQVRELSKKSNDAAGEIRTILQQSHQEIVNGEELMDKTHTELTDIIKQINDIQGQTGSINQIVVRQSEVIQELHAASEEFSEGTSNTAGISQEVAQLGGELTAQATKVKEMVMMLDSALEGSKA